jgi:hypothetical protein
MSKSITCNDHHTSRDQLPWPRTWPELLSAHTCGAGCALLVLRAVASSVSRSPSLRNSTFSGAHAFTLLPDLAFPSLTSASLPTAAAAARLDAVLPLLGLPAWPLVPALPDLLPPAPDCGPDDPAPSFSLAPLLNQTVGCSNGLMVRSLAAVLWAGRH